MDEPATRSGGTRVLVADGYSVVREGLSCLIENTPGLEVVGAPGDLEEAMRAARAKRPDVVLLDLSGPGKGAAQAVRRMLESLPGLRIVALTPMDEPELAAEVMEAGVQGCLPEEAAFAEVRAAITAVAAGRRYVSRHCAASAERPKPRRDASLEELTYRERQVLAMLAEGRSVKQIAATIGRSPKTVDAHRRNLSMKLQIDNVAGLTKFALRHGLVRL